MTDLTSKKIVMSIPVVTAYFVVALINYNKYLFFLIYLMVISLGVATDVITALDDTDEHSGLLAFWMISLFFPVLAILFLPPDVARFVIHFCLALHGSLMLVIFDIMGKALSQEGRE